MQALYSLIAFLRRITNMSAPTEPECNGDNINININTIIIKMTRLFINSSSFRDVFNEIDLGNADNFRCLPKAVQCILPAAALICRIFGERLLMTNSSGALSLNTNVLASYEKYKQYTPSNTETVSDSISRSIREQHHVNAHFYFEILRSDANLNFVIHMLNNNITHITNAINKLLPKYVTSPRLHHAGMADECLDKLIYGDAATDPQNALLKCFSNPSPNPVVSPHLAGWEKLFLDMINDITTKCTALSKSVNVWITDIQQYVAHEPAESSVVLARIIERLESLDGVFKCVSNHMAAFVQNGVLIVETTSTHHFQQLVLCTDMLSSLLRKANCILPYLLFVDSGRLQCKNKQPKLLRMLLSVFSLREHTIFVDRIKHNVLPDAAPVLTSALEDLASAAISIIEKSVLPTVLLSILKSPTQTQGAASPESSLRIEVLRHFLVFLKQQDPDNLAIIQKRLDSTELDPFGECLNNMPDIFSSGDSAEPFSSKMHTMVDNAFLRTLQESANIKPKVVFKGNKLSSLLIGESHNTAGESSPTRSDAMNHFKKRRYFKIVIGIIVVVYLIIVLGFVAWMLYKRYYNSADFTLMEFHSQ